MRTIGIVTSSRADYGIYLPVLKRIQQEPSLDLRLLVTGSHLSPEFGRTVSLIEQDGFAIEARVEMLLSSDTPEGIAKSMGLGTLGFAQVFASFRPDILMVLGDRFEMHSVALAALPFKIPIAHIHGGELTEGAIDDALRHSLTKLSHLHFVSTEEYSRRVIQLGEEPWRVTVCGAPSLDNLNDIKLLDRNGLKQRLGLELPESFFLVTFHPTTLEYDQAGKQTDELLAALREAGRPILFTMPNADTAGREIRERILRYVEKERNAQAVESIGTEGYFSVMALAEAMVGNSSSGIVEAASLCLPVVNIGTRQGGRVRSNNVIDVGYSRTEVLKGLGRILEPGIRRALEGLVNPYGQGGASKVIVERLCSVLIDRSLIAKNFYDIGAPRVSTTEAGDC